MIYEDPKKHKTSGKMFSGKPRIGESFLKKSSNAGHALCRKNRYNKSASGCRDTDRETNMNETYITTELLAQYAQQLYEEEKSRATIEKYIRTFTAWLEMQEQKDITKDCVIRYKKHLEENYKTSSANSMLIALNGFFGYTGWYDCYVTIFKTQPNHIYAQEQEMTRAEYEKLIATAKGDDNLRLAMIIEIIGSTGMRISELASVTVEAVGTGKISISCKGKHREIYLVHKLKMKLIDYCKKKDIRSGAVFITKNGNPVDRSNIWTEMKKNAEKAGVALKKAFPHNLRHFFARTYYNMHKNISHLEDILGHSSINTTRIYVATTEEDHVKKLERLDLVV